MNESISEVSGAAQMESGEFVPVKVMPGRIGKLGEDFEGQAVAYFVRPESVEQSIDVTEFQTMIEAVLGGEALDFIAGYSRTPDEVKAEADEMARKINDPTMQAKIRAWYAQRRMLADELRS